MSDAVTINEKVARATRSSHLQHKEQPSDIDTIGALGMAGVENNLASAVFRLKYANEARFYPSALIIVTAECQRLQLKHNWPASSYKFAKLTKACLDYWLNDKCMACEGRGAETILGTPVLSNEACSVCHGSTKLPKPSMATKEWDERFDMLLKRIEDLERRAGGDVMARLARDVADFR